MHHTPDCERKTDFSMERCVRWEINPQKQWIFYHVYDTIIKSARREWSCNGLLKMYLMNPDRSFY